MSESRTPLLFHAERDRLLAEAHARPSTPVAAPLLASRLASLTGEGKGQADCDHMARLCRKVGAPGPAPEARWFMLEAGAWRMRWERHTETSTWTVFRPLDRLDADVFSDRALDVLPPDWLADIPGDILVAAHAALCAKAPARPVFVEADLVASSVAGGSIEVSSDYRQGPDGFTRFLLVQKSGGPVLAGRVLQQIFELETYRLLALLAFPLATTSAGRIGRMEAETAEAALQVSHAGGVEADRRLLASLAALAGRAEAFAGGASFRFAASRAYYGLVLQRVAQLNEAPLSGRPSLGEFMERRLAPAMRTCEARSERIFELIERIDRTTRMLSARVQVEAEATNVSLLASMDNRAQVQLRLQETVEGLSTVAIAYYALNLFKLLMEGLRRLHVDVDPSLATALAAPVFLYVVWLFLHRMRRRIFSGQQSHQPAASASG